ncbi:MAG: hypothetical protein JF591_18135, partial [Lysobacter sp.]|nr:hypothetical protein [Lysobacter sp.]
RGVYASALRHLAPFARQLAGPQAVPVPSPEARLREAQMGGCGHPPRARAFGGGNPARGSGSDSGG